MQTRLLGATDLLVSEIGFGGFAIGGNVSGHSYGPTDDTTSGAAVLAAIDGGCNFFDTADVYGWGHSETLLGRIFRARNCLYDVIIATKGGARFSEGVTRPDFSSSYLQSAVEHSLKRLQREFIDLYQLHCPPLALLQDGELFDTLRGLRKRGLIRHFGVSVHTPQEARAVLAIPGVAALQIPYSILSMLEPDFSCGEILPLAASANVGIIAREPLAAGMLSGKHNVDREYEPGDLRGGWTAARRRLYVALAASLKHLERPGVTLAQAALRFALDEPTITTTIVGMKTPQQVAENLAAVYAPSFERLYASRTESNSSISGAV